MDSVDELLEIVKLIADLITVCTANVAPLVDLKFVGIAFQGVTAIFWVVNCSHDADRMPWYLTKAQGEDWRCIVHLANAVGWFVEFGGNILNHGRRVLRMRRPPALRFVRVPGLKWVMSMGMVMMIALALLGC